MAPNKFEKHIKKQLEEREIKPAAEAWEKLSEKLDLAAPQKRKKGYVWFGIAASIIGLLMISVVYFNNKNSLESQNIQIVNSPKKVDSLNNVVGIDLPSEDQTNKNQNNIDSTTNFKSEKITDLNDVEVDFSEDKIVLNEIAKQEIHEDKSVLVEVDIVDSKIQEVIAQVDVLEKNNISLTDVEVDSLLRIAQEEILRENLFNKNGSVDAIALLTEVEGELNETFRDQIFESLKAGFLKVRTAVADRNN